MSFEIPDTSGARAAPPTPWLTLGFDHGNRIVSQQSVLTVGLEPSSVEALLADGLAVLRAEPAVVLGAGGHLEGLPSAASLHYDMTGTCSESHAHVTWDPAQLPRTVITFAAQELLPTAIDPDGTWRPPADAGTNFAAYIHPQTWSVMPLMCEVLWAAGAAGHGVREAMDWLSSDELANVAAYCRSMSGPNPPPLIEMAESVINGPPAARAEAVYLAWQALAPVEEINRSADGQTGTQPLDVGSWMASRSVLAISLPHDVKVAHHQIVAALLVAAVQTQREAMPSAEPVKPPCIWRELDRPRHWAWNKTNGPALVFTGRGSQFAGWLEPDLRCDILVGANADHEALDAAATLLGRPLTAPPLGQVIVIREGRATALPAPGGAGPGMRA